MKILFINPPVFNDIGSVKTDTPPLGLLYLAAYLEKNGYKDIKVIDGDAAMISWNELENIFQKEQPDIVGITSPSFMMPALLKTAKLARKNVPHCHIIAGGYGPTKEPEKILNQKNQTVDFIVMGEGELTTLELVKKLENKTENFNDVKGIAYLDKNKQLVITAPRGYVMDLNTIPWPAYHLLFPHFSKYRGMPFQDKLILRPTATMFASRGCPHRCTFCSLGSKVYRARDPKDIVAEMQFYIDQFGVKSIQIYDDEFMGLNAAQNNWIEEICDEIIDKGLHKKLSFIIQARCSPFIEFATLKKMKEANFVWIWWGVESGSQKILDIIKKDIKVENIIRDFALAKQAGIKSSMFVMVGFPGETPTDIKQTSNLIKKVKPDRINVHIVSPYPGSEMRKYFEKHKFFEINDYYKSDSLQYALHHTDEMTSAEIKKYYKMLVFRFKSGYWYFAKFFVKSLFTADGWKKLGKRVKIASDYFVGWIKMTID